jgi:putative tryptophan/tyrosine transport system substrate-binding protein
MGAAGRIFGVSSGALAVIEAFDRGLKEHGYEDGRNVVLEWLWIEGTRLPAIAGELVRLNVDLIAVPGEAHANAVRQATNTIPIVFFVVGDPVAVGYAASLRRPGRMFTGLRHSGPT